MAWLVGDLAKAKATLERLCAAKRYTSERGPCLTRGIPRGLQF